MKEQRYLDELNGIQREAATHTTGPLLIVAGPGSGKTRVLTYRISYLIDSGVRPDQILALTFTNKAAREMKERIERVVGERARNVMAGTFHSLFARILRAEAEHIGYTRNFTIYDTDDSKSLLTAIIKQKGLAGENYQTNAVYSRISSAKSGLVSPIYYQQRADLLEQDRQAKRPEVVAIYEEYARRCKQADAMDFDDLLYQFYVLLHKNEGVRMHYARRFQHILVDEFQDTNFAQYGIIKKLTLYDGSPRNICAVGDDAQSIYAFRGATIENIFDYEKDFPGIKTYKLEQNYRSTPYIIEAANNVINYNKKQIQKTIWTDKPEGQKIRLIRAVQDTEESRRIADSIIEQKNRFHLRNSEIAILYRTNAQSRSFEEALRRNNINYRIIGGLSFYQRKEVKDMVAYLRLAVNQYDEEALRRVINYPRRGIGDTTVDKISALADANNLRMYDAVQQFPASSRESGVLAPFLKLVKDASAKAQVLNAYETAIYLYRASGIEKEMKADTTPEGVGRLQNMAALMEGIAEFINTDEEVDAENQQDKSLATYLQNISLLTDADQAKEDTDTITLMSVHGSKGLEFKSVFVVGLEENLFPSFMAGNTPEGMDEERRLFYVAITRAERFLTLSFSLNRYIHGKSRDSKPSRFILEVGAENVEGGIGLNRASAASDNSGPNRSGVSGGRLLSPAAALAAKKASVLSPELLSNFIASPADHIKPGLRVLHQKFGEGNVLAIEGSSDNRVATIEFSGIEEPKRRLMLKFAKLQVLS